MWRGCDYYMEIIKHGDPEKLKGTKYFICNKCGCEFKADNTEYEERLVDFISAVEYVIACPECGNETLGTDIPEPKKSKPRTKAYDFCKEHDCDNYSQSICIGCDEYCAWAAAGRPNDWDKWRTKSRK